MGHLAGTRHPPRALAAFLALLALFTLAGCSGSDGKTPVGTGALARCGLTRILVPRCGVLWGVHVASRRGELPDTIRALEREVHRPFDVVHVYHDMSPDPRNRFPTAGERAIQGGPRMLYVSWEPRRYDTGRLIPWHAVADGSLDATVIDPTARNVRSTGDPMFISFAPEPDRFVGAQGTVDDYIAAYRHIRQRFDELGVRNVVWVWTTTGYLPNRQLIQELYPGDAYVDWIGWDPYNFAGCHSHAWNSFSDSVVPFYQWLLSEGHGKKPFMLPEYGTVDDPRDPTIVNAWYRSIPVVLRTHPQIKAAIAFDSDVECDTTIPRRASTLRAFAAAGLDPYITGGASAPQRQRR